MNRPVRSSLWRSFYFAGRGLAEAIAGQRNVRLHLAMTVAVLGLAVWLQASRLEWLLLLACIGGVLAVELINTAIETVVDLASPQTQDLARRAKDIAAAAVLVSALIAALIGGAILFPRAWAAWIGEFR